MLGSAFIIFGKQGYSPNAGRGQEDFEYIIQAYLLFQEFEPSEDSNIDIKKRNIQTWNDQEGTEEVNSSLNVEDTIWCSPDQNLKNKTQRGLFWSVDQIMLQSKMKKIVVAFQNSLLEKNFIKNVALADGCKSHFSEEFIKAVRGKDRMLSVVNISNINWTSILITWPYDAKISLMIVNHPTYMAVSSGRMNTSSIDRKKVRQRCSIRTAVYTKIQATRHTCQERFIASSNLINDQARIPIARLLTIRQYLSGNADFHCVPAIGKRLWVTGTQTEVMELSHVREYQFTKIWGDEVWNPAAAAQQPAVRSAKNIFRRFKDVNQETVELSAEDGGNRGLWKSPAT